MTQNTNKWIRVNEGLPERGKMCLVVYCGVVQHVALQFSGGKFSWGADSRFEYECDSFPSGEVTHWMPLPEPPND